jgi:hypothetical protein
MPTEGEPLVQSTAPCVPSGAHVQHSQASPGCRAPCARCVPCPGTGIGTAPHRLDAGPRSHAKVEPRLTTLMEASHRRPRIDRSQLAQAQVWQTCSEVLSMMQPGVSSAIPGS